MHVVVTITSSDNWYGRSSGEDVRPAPSLDERLPFLAAGNETTKAAGGLAQGPDAYVNLVFDAVNFCNATPVLPANECGMSL